MAKKGGNSKAEAAKEKKDAAKKKQDDVKRKEQENKEAEKWSTGAKGKSKKELEAEKKAEQAAKKEEAARLLAEEEKSLKSAKPKPAKSKGAPPKSTIPEFAATNLEDAIDLLSLNKSSASSKDVEKHPERRYKAALAAFEERELPRFKEENPGLRLTQLKELMYKAFQKSPENPFNKVNLVDYNASQDEIKDKKDQTRKQLEDRFRV